jgi:hypothetical protein
MGSTMTENDQNSLLDKLVRQYSFAEGFVAGLDINRSERLLTIDFEALPYKNGHPKYSAIRLAKNSVKGTLYADEDLCSGQLSLVGCEFELLDLGTSVDHAQKKVAFESSRAVEFFDLGTAKSRNRLELVADDVRVICLFEDVTFRETTG